MYLSVADSFVVSSAFCPAVTLVISRAVMYIRKYNQTKHCFSLCFAVDKIKKTKKQVNKQLNTKQNKQVFPDVVKYTVSCYFISSVHLSDCAHFFHCLLFLVSKLILLIYVLPYVLMFKYSVQKWKFYE